MRKRIILLFSALFLPAAPVLAGELDLGLNYASGVSEIRGVNISVETKKGSFVVSSVFKYSRENGQSSQDSLGQSLNYDHKLDRKWALWVFNFASYDRIQKINFENSFGGGPKYTFVESKDLELSLSGGIMQDHVDYESAESRNLARFSGRLKTGWQINPDVHFDFVGFYQPNLADFTDYIFTISAGLSRSITKTVSLKVKLDDSYRSRTEARKHNDLSSTLALSMSF